MPDDRTSASSASRRATEPPPSLVVARPHRPASAPRPESAQVPAPARRAGQDRPLVARRLDDARQRPLRCPAGLDACQELAARVVPLPRPPADDAPVPASVVRRRTRSHD